MAISYYQAKLRDMTRCIFLSEITKAYQSSLFHVQVTAGRLPRAQAIAVANELKNQEPGLGEAAVILIVVSSRMLDANGLGFMGTLYSTTKKHSKEILRVDSFECFWSFVLD